MKKWLPFLSAIPLLFGACQKTQPTLFQLLTPAQTGIDFANTLSESDSLNILNYVYYYNGGGVGIADFDNDGWEDIFFTGNENSCRLYRNLGGLRFEDVTDRVGLRTDAWCTGVALADINADGWTDIYVCTAGHPQAGRRRNLFFENQGKNGGLKFFEKAADYGIADTAYSTQAAFFDADRDGDLDLYLTNHANDRATLNTPLPKKTDGQAPSNDRFFKNNGIGSFTDATREAGFLTEGYGLGLAVGDFNRDGWPDIYVANDFIYNDLLYINAGEQGGVGRFSNQISSYLRSQTYNSMGCDFADLDNDLRPDLVTVDMLPETDAARKRMAGSMTWDKWQLVQAAGYEPQFMRNTLQLAVDGGRLTVDGEPSTVNRQPSTAYAEIGQFAGIAATDWSWAPLLADFDNDGWKDLFITNGYLRDITDRDFLEYSANLSMFKNQADADRDLLPKIRQLDGKRLPNRIFKNNRDLTFSEKSVAWGMPQPSCSNGAAYADLDRDGDLDLVVNNLNEQAFIFENTADKMLKNNYLNLRLEGPAGNPAGIGAAVRVVAEGRRQLVKQQPVRGFQSSVSQVLHLGFEKILKIDSLEIRWPDGARQLLTDVATNQFLTLKHRDASRPQPTAEAAPPAVLLRNATAQWGIEFVHNELVFNDFQTQPLLPHGFSENGPPLAVGDLDGDGAADFYVGGAKNQPGRIFFQKTDGSFSKKDLAEGSEAEDVAALIFDADGDGRNDLFVVSGGSEWPPGSPFLQSRLYLNAGKGQLKWSKNALPEALQGASSCAAAADFDGDGDLDLFVGGSAEPGRYPLPGPSFLLRNAGGKFTDATDELAPFLKKTGIVAAAKWADLDKNGWPDLVLAGEWMPISVFKNLNGKLSDATVEMGLSKTNGWWNALEISDLDADGDFDLVAGNLGLNTRYRASEREPLRIYAKDFDGNGSLDAIPCHFAEGREKPLHHRDELARQLLGLGKKYPRHAAFAEASVQEIFGEKALAEAYLRQCNFLESACFFQENGRFQVKSLPAHAQFAPVNAVLCADFDGDARTDILLTGNSHAHNITTGHCDASSGLLLLADGAGGFRATGAERSGFFADGVGKSFALLPLRSGKKLVLAGMNGGRLEVFEVLR